MQYLEAQYSLLLVVVFILVYFILDIFILSLFILLYSTVFYCLSVFLDKSNCDTQFPLREVFLFYSKKPTDWMTDWLRQTWKCVWALFMLCFTTFVDFLSHSLTGVNVLSLNITGNIWDNGGARLTKKGCAKNRYGNISQYLFCDICIASWPRVSYQDVLVKTQPWSSLTQKNTCTLLCHAFNFNVS